MIRVYCILKNHLVKGGFLVCNLLVLRYMKTILKWSLLLTGLMPLVYSAGSLFPYIFPKALFFRFCIVVAIVAFCVACSVNNAFRNEMIVKIKSLWKHSVFKIMTLMYAGMVVSTIFAFDTYMAMFGNIEREEGFLGLLFFYVFFVLITMVFERKDWLRFFAVNMFTGGILFFVELNQSLVDNNSRPGSLTDNPIFLATYFVFVIFCAFVIYRAGQKRKNLLVVVGAVSSIVILFVGIFITQTRGTLLGMFIGAVVAFVYFGMTSENVTVYKNISLRKFFVIGLIAFGLVATVFISTRHADVWTHIPGLSRIAQISSTDATTQARFVNASIALHAVNPKEATVMRSLFGWGWDNYVYAWQKFYNPALYKYDAALFDRAHDRVLDVLLMTGIVGFVLYIGLWIAFFREAIKKGKKFSVEIAMFIFWGVAFFLQNLTVFDTLVTFITFYAMFAYLTYETRQNTIEIIK